MSRIEIKTNNRILKGIKYSDNHIVEYPEKEIKVLVGEIFEDFCNCINSVCKYGYLAVCFDSNRGFYKSSDLGDKNVIYTIEDFYLHPENLFISFLNFRDNLHLISIIALYKKMHGVDWNPSNKS